MGCFSGRLMSSASDQKLFCDVCSAFKCSFDEFLGEKVVSPSYSSTIFKRFILKMSSERNEDIKLVIFFFFSQQFTRAVILRPSQQCTLFLGTLTTEDKFFFLQEEENFGGALSTRTCSYSERWVICLEDGERGSSQRKYWSMFHLLWVGLDMDGVHFTKYQVKRFLSLMVF